MQTRDFHITCADGYVLSATLWIPKQDTGRIIQFHNGTGIPASLYHHFWTYLAEEGFTVLAFDYRGMGQSLEGSLAESKATIAEWAYQDMTAVFEWVLAHYPTHKKILMGHSMGGQLFGMMHNAVHADLLVMIASSTGYWKDMPAPFKWFTALAWNVLIPFSNALAGYAKASFFGSGDDLPKEVAAQWRKWCMSPTYYEVDFETALAERYHHKLGSSLLSVRTTDDPIANDTTVEKLLAYYRNNKIERWRFIPEKLGLKKLGHAGFFSRKVKQIFWKPLVAYIREHVQVTKGLQET
ncbi:MAG: alpha/beta fold hydrolase [Bacteroidota bacterium]